MNETFKTELAAFARDVNAICDSNPDTCEHCPLIDADGYCKGGFLNSKFDTEAAIAAVEAYRKRKKPCAEVIDRCVDIYTIEVEMLRGRASAQSWTPKQGAEYAVGCIKNAYQGDCATVRVLSAKRFALQSHRESDREDAE